MVCRYVLSIASGMRTTIGWNIPFPKTAHFVLRRDRPHRESIYKWWVSELVQSNIFFFKTHNASVGHKYCMDAWAKYNDRKESGLKITSALSEGHVKVVQENVYCLTKKSQGGREFYQFYHQLIKLLHLIGNFNRKKYLTIPEMQNTHTIISRTS